MKTRLYNHRTKSAYTLDLFQWIRPFDDGSTFYQNWYAQILRALDVMYYRNATDDCFQYTYNSNGANLLIHFNIGHIYSQCEKQPLLLLRKEKVPLNKFDIYSFPCEYAYHYALNWKFPAHAVSDFPVLCCYAPVQKNNQLLVIDGNHRVTIKKMLHIKSVNLFEYQVNSPLDFANDFEYLVFHFLMEYNKPPQDRLINPADGLSMPWLDNKWNVLHQILMF